MRWPEPYLQGWWWPQGEPCTLDPSWAQGSETLANGLHGDQTLLLTSTGPASISKVGARTHTQACVLYKSPPPM